MLTHLSHSWAALHRSAAPVLASVAVTASLGPLLPLSTAGAGTVSREAGPQGHTTGELAGAACTNPVFRSAARYGIWSGNGYFVFNNMWNEPGPPSSGPGSQELFVCSFHSWYVVADMPSPGQPAYDVKTYPNVQENFPSVPVSKFSRLVSNFAESSPHVGDYEDAYDMWLNGIATSTSNEVMIWNEDHGQTPAGSIAAHAFFNGVAYTVWKTGDGRYIAFVADRDFTSGSLDLLAFYRWLTSNGWIQAGSVVDQVDYGVEICSTGGAPAEFGFTNFSIKTQY